MKRARFDVSEVKLRPMNYSSFMRHLKPMRNSSYKMSSTMVCEAGVEGLG